MDQKKKKKNENWSDQKKKNGSTRSGTFMEQRDTHCRTRMPSDECRRRREREISRGRSRELWCTAAALRRLVLVRSYNLLSFIWQPTKKICQKVIIFLIPNEYLLFTIYILFRLPQYSPINIWFYAIYRLIISFFSFWEMNWLIISLGPINYFLQLINFSPFQKQVAF